MPHDEARRLSTEALFTKYLEGILEFVRKVSKTTHPGNRRVNPQALGELDEGDLPRRVRLPDVLQLRDIDKPEIGDDEVLLRVHAAGVGRDVWHVMSGLPYPASRATDSAGRRTPS